jgi:hypothetical protein
MARFNRNILCVAQKGWLVGIESDGTEHTLQQHICMLFNLLFWCFKKLCYGIFSDITRQINSSCSFMRHW